MCQTTEITASSTRYAFLDDESGDWIEVRPGFVWAEKLDVERLVRAIQAEDLNRGYRARSGRSYRDQARFIAAEYARLTADRTPEVLDDPTG